MVLTLWHSRSSSEVIQLCIEVTIRNLVRKAMDLHKIGRILCHMELNWNSIHRQPTAQEHVPVLHAGECDPGRRPDQPDTLKISGTTKDPANSLHKLFAETLLVFLN
jgi:hypothetical protein